MPMKNPPHPGRSIRNACLEPLGLSVTEGARVLGVTRQALNNVVNGKSGISPDMAIRLTKPSAAPLKRGCGCNSPTISPQPVRTNARSKFAESALVRLLNRPLAAGFAWAQCGGRIRLSPGWDAAIDLDRFLSGGL